LKDLVDDVHDDVVCLFDIPSQKLRLILLPKQMSAIQNLLVDRQVLSEAVEENCGEVVELANELVDRFNLHRFVALVDLHQARG